MRLGEFISSNMESILMEWEDFARAIQPPGGDMQVIALRDHAKEMLVCIVRDMGATQTEHERTVKSQGNSPRTVADTAAEAHADERLEAGFSIRLLVAEYRALRATVLRLWLKGVAADKQGDAGAVEDLIRFNEAIDQALAESVTRYSDAVGENADIFIGMLGHDLRSPLQVLSFGAVKLKNMEDAGNSLNQLGEIMIAGVDRMREMLDNLMDFTASRIGGGVTINPAPADLGRICRQLVNEFRSAHGDHRFTLAVTGDCAGTWDASRIGQIGQNLISNAVQHGLPKGEIAVSCEGREDQVILRVRSEGVPIPEAQQRNIFELTNLKQRAQGNLNKNLGLGLYIVRELVLAHQGRVGVESGEGAGTVFTVALPRAQG
jgi:signal transduction histidine kinase